jgi:carotenoid 1,2-hydratase
MSLSSFTQPVADNGYRWWYLDAISDDGVHALTVIVFIGSVFSPYYARARKRHVQPASQHCAVNVALYGPVSRWAMTERNHVSLHAQHDLLSIGKSSLTVRPGQLLVDIDEVTVPVPGRLRGRLTLDLPEAVFRVHALDAAQDGAALHHWQPIAPIARIDVQMQAPALSWTGTAYMDSNWGAVPLEHTFRSWTWSRSHDPERRTTILYDVVDRDGGIRRKSLQFDRHGEESSIDTGEVHTLAPTRYFRIPRMARIPAQARIDQLQTLEDTPFYSRSRFIEHHPLHRQVTMHESLDLMRFDTSWVRCLLPFRMPRTTRRVLRNVQ